MENKTLVFLKRRRNTLIKKLIQLDGLIIQGSLIERYKRCGKSNCKCAQGKGHGPKYYLSINQPGGYPKMKYILQKDIKTVQNYIQNYLCLRKILKEISMINLELLRREKL